MTGQQQSPRCHSDGCTGCRVCEVEAEVVVSCQIVKSLIKQDVCFCATVISLNFIFVFICLFERHRWRGEGAGTEEERDFPFVGSSLKCL